ncbi:Hypothetical predicted protein [Pelobates cultripes]|uniref:Uncharacterized protein n=1 Tax=Pelobates cultripes TaxID=61616 RepID=A0AAD1TDH0_PELCU|nr:Hypothetical predicted protein [Pelobates cultripes]
MVLPKRPPRQQLFQVNCAQRSCNRKRLLKPSLMLCANHSGIVSHPECQYLLHDYPMMPTSPLILLPDQGPIQRLLHTIIHAHMGYPNHGGLVCPKSSHR